MSIRKSLHGGRNVSVDRRCLWGILSAISAGLFPGLSSQASSTEVQQSWVWSAYGNGIGRSGLVALDSDGDGSDEIIAASATQDWPYRDYWYEVRNTDGLRQTWSSLPESTDILDILTVGSGPESFLLLVMSNEVRVQDVRTKSQIGAFQHPAQNLLAFAAEDLDQDGDVELVTCDEYDLRVQAIPSGDLIATKFGFGCEDLAIGQVDGDLQLELVLAGNPSGGYVLDGLTLTVDWAWKDDFGVPIAVGNLDADPADEIVGGWSAMSAGLTAFDASTSRILWQASGPQATDIVIANLDGEGGDEVIAASEYGDRIRILNGATGVTIRTIVEGADGARRPVVADTDGDGTMEVVWASGDEWTTSDRLLVAEGESTVPDFSTTPLWGPVVGAEWFVSSADGGPVVVAVLSSSTPAEDFPALVVLGAENGRMLRWSGEASFVGFGGGPKASVAGQLDTDPQAEICVGGISRAQCLDSLDFSSQWSVGIPDQAYAMELAEIDGDPFPELILGTIGPYLRAHEGDSGWLKWRTPPVSGSWPYLFFDYVSVLDLSGDGLQEVVGATLQLYSNLTTFAPESGDVDLESWTINETAMTSRPHPSQAGDQLIAVSEQGDLRTLDPHTQTMGPTLASFSGQPNAIVLADLDRDGVDDFVVRLAYTVKVADGVTGEIEWESPFLGEVRSVLVAGDFDGDSLAEFIVGTSSGLARFEASLLGVFADGFESGGVGNWSGSFP